MADLTSSTKSAISKTSTPKAPSNHREFFAKLYGSLDEKTSTEEKLDVSSGSDESFKSSSLGSINNNSKIGSEEDEDDHDDRPQVVPRGASGKGGPSPPPFPLPLHPLRPFPQLAAVGTQLPPPPQIEGRPHLLPYFPPPPLHPQNAAPGGTPVSNPGGGGPPTPNSALESTLRLADFPFPGGLAAFCK